MDKLLKKINKEKIQISAGPFSFIEYISRLKFKQNEIGDFKKFTDLEKSILNIIDFNFYKLFIKNEAIKSLNFPTYGPFMMPNSNKMNIAYLKKNELQIKSTFPIASYSPHEKILTWYNFGLLKDVCINDLDNKLYLYFCKYNKIINIDVIEADKIILWFRTMIFYKNIKLSKGINNNLIKFNILNNNKTYNIYTISDHEYKDPKFTKDHSTIMGVINTMHYTIFGYSTKNLKKRASIRKGSKKKDSKKKGSKNKASKRRVKSHKIINN